MANKTTYYPTIGIECHVQLKTATKLFAGVGNDARDAKPNTLISHICLGMPGALPVLNEKVLELATRVAFAFGTTPQKLSYFERKHYFYPDLPKGYQITQLQKPIIVGGHVSIEVDGKQKNVALNRVQIEEDAGKNTHPVGTDYSLVDLNRAGTPLLEIVSEPDMHSPEETKAYVKELYLLMRYTDVSDADMYHGNMRFDVNVSLSDKKDVLGTRSETKNLNSFRSVEKAVAYEIKRQTELLEKGEKIVQETRGWDDAKQKTTSQRGKEEAHDYRYFPEPDVPPIELKADFIDAVRKTMPTLPSEWRTRLESLGLDSKHTDVLLEAEVAQEGVNYLHVLEGSLQDKPRAQFIANWFVNNEIPLRQAEAIEPKAGRGQAEGIYAQVYTMVQANKLSSTNAKNLLSELLRRGSPEDVETYATQQGYLQVSNTKEIEEIVKKVLVENAKATQDVANGEAKAIGFLVGQVMKESKGQANPQLAQELIKKMVKDSRG